MPNIFPFGTIRLTTFLPVFALMAVTIGLLSIASDANLPPVWPWLRPMLTFMRDSRPGALAISMTWAGALLPLELIRVPQTELHAPTVFLLFQTRGFGYLERYVSPPAVLLPINLLEVFQNRFLSASDRPSTWILAPDLPDYHFPVASSSRNQASGRKSCPRPSFSCAGLTRLGIFGAAPDFLARVPLWIVGLLVGLAVVSLLTVFFYGSYAV